MPCKLLECTSTNNLERYKSTVEAVLSHLSFMFQHPDIYQRAVLRNPVRNAFTSKVDLWSLGVTLFHVGTGQLPFKPFGGRKNRDKMYENISFISPIFSLKSGAFKVIPKLSTKVHSCDSIIDTCSYFSL